MKEGSEPYIYLVEEHSRQRAQPVQRPQGSTVSGITNVRRPVKLDAVNSKELVEVRSFVFTQHEVDSHRWVLTRGNDMI